MPVQTCLCVCALNYYNTINLYVYLYTHLCTDMYLEAASFAVQPVDEHPGGSVSVRHVS